MWAYFQTISIDLIPMCTRGSDFRTLDSSRNLPVTACTYFFLSNKKQEPHQQKKDCFYLFSGRCKNRPLKKLAQFGIRRRAWDAADGECDGQESQSALDPRGGGHLQQPGFGARVAGSYFFCQLSQVFPPPLKPSFLNSHSDVKGEGGFLRARVGTDMDKWSLTCTRLYIYINI